VKTVLLVGAGPSSCVIARNIVDTFEDVKVTIVEKRKHIAGNCYDYKDELDLFVHQYGPHYFRTNSVKQLNWLRRFSEFIDAQYVVQCSVAGKLYNFPVNLNTMEQITGKKCSEKDFKEYLLRERKNIASPKNAEEQCLSAMGTQLYELFFKGYTQKQWGVSAAELSPEITARIPLRFNKSNVYVNEEFQVMPKKGYTHLFRNMIDDERIEVVLNQDFFDFKKENKYDLLVYSGEVDRYFDYSLGKLKYRSLSFKKKIFKNVNFKQSSVQINYPNEFEHTRTVEIKHVTGQVSPHTNLVYEFPENNGEPFYPFLDAHNKKIALEYRKMTRDLESENIFFVGRLADFKYYNMNHVMEIAQHVFDSKIKIKLGIS